MYINNILSMLAHHNIARMHICETKNICLLNALAYFLIKKTLSPVYFCMYNLCSYTFLFNKMLDLQILRLNWICNHWHLSRNKKKSRDLTLKSRRYWTLEIISQVGTPDDCELGHFCDQKEISLVKKRGIRCFFKLCFWWLSEALFWNKGSLKCFLRKKKDN